MTQDEGMTMCWHNRRKHLFQTDGNRAVVARETIQTLPVKCAHASTVVVTTKDGTVALLVVGGSSPEPTRGTDRPSWAQHTFWARDARSKTGVYASALGTLTLNLAGCGDVQGDLVRTTRRALGHAKLADAHSSVAIGTRHSAIQRETTGLALSPVE